MQTKIDPNNHLTDDEIAYLLLGRSPDDIAENAMNKINHEIEVWSKTDKNCEIEYWWLSTRICAILENRLQFKKFLDIRFGFCIIESMRKAIIQEGVHTVSVYFPPDAVMLVLGRFAEGLTMVFDTDGFQPEFDTVFAKEGEFTDDELKKLEQEAHRLVIAFYNGELK